MNNLKDNEVVCSHIAVDCVENDSQDIRIGGPQYIGYDFYVEREKAEEMIEFIEKVLERTGAPLLSIYVAGTVVKEKEDVWTKEKINKCISNNEGGIEKEYFKQEGRSF